MAQPQGLNIPAIATTAVVTVMLTGVIVEGVRALYAYDEPRVEEARWNELHGSTVNNLRDEQEKNIKFNTSVPIDQAMAKVVKEGAKKNGDPGLTVGRSTPDEGEKTIATLIADSRQLCEKGQYKDALKVVNQILILDPKNEYASVVRATLIDKGESAENLKPASTQPKG